MKLLISQDELNSSKSMALVPLQCLNCDNVYRKEASYVRRDLRNNTGGYCSRTCAQAVNRNGEFLTCPECSAPFYRKMWDIKKNKANFCSTSCATTFYQRTREKITRSRAEIDLYNFLVESFPNLTFVPNDKTALGGMEIDIWVPQLMLGIQWNGPMHYLPIFGPKALHWAQCRDVLRRKRAQESNINLIEIADIKWNSYPKFVQSQCPLIAEIVKGLISDQDNNDTPL